MRRICILTSNRFLKLQIKYCFVVCLNIADLVLPEFWTSETALNLLGACPTRANQHRRWLENLFPSHESIKHLKVSVVISFMISSDMQTVWCSFSFVFLLKNTILKRNVLRFRQLRFHFSLFSSHHSTVNNFDV